MINPGGRLVAIMGEGVFFGQDKKAVAFREWLESVGGTSEKLPDGSFQDPTLPVRTGTATRMVVIDKGDSLAVSMTGDYYLDYAKTAREFNERPYAERQARLDESLAEATGVPIRVQPDAGRSGQGVDGRISGVGEGVQRTTGRTEEGEYLRYSILANGVARDFADRGATNLIGQEGRNSHDLAVAAQVYRNPKIETARYFFIKGGHERA